MVTANRLRGFTQDFLSRSIFTAFLVLGYDREEAVFLPLEVLPDELPIPEVVC